MEKVKLNLEEKQLINKLIFVRYLNGDVGK